jgi:hypothetical protein
MLTEPPTAPGRHTTTLYLLSRDEQGPDADEPLGEAVSFDRRDPQSIRRARAIVQDRLKLPAAPTLCNAPSPAPGAAMRWIVATLRRFGRGERAWIADEARDG